MEPLVYDTHMHTPLCRHAKGEPEEYAVTAQRRGLKGITITCHNPLPGGYSQDARMYPDQLVDYLALVARARQAWAGRVDVRLGLECDVVPGMERFIRQQAESAPFDYLLGSVHPQTPEFHAAFWRGDALAFQRVYFEHLARVAESGLVDCLSHPDMVKNVFPSQWNLARLLPDISGCLDRIAATGCAMELNTSGLNKDIPEMNPGPQILREMARRGIPVVVGSDAHEPARVADRFEQAYDLLEAAGYQRTSWFLQRRRLDIPIAEARRSLVRPGMTTPVAS